MADRELAAEAFLYGFPLVRHLAELLAVTRVGTGTIAATPFNRFGHASHLPTPGDKLAGIETDALCSIAPLDLRDGPLLLGVPDTSGCDYVLQFVDAWTNNFAYVGTRATGAARAAFLLTPPGWAGDAPAGVRRIAVPTTVATIVGRWACDGEGDLPAVQRLQRALTLEPFAPAGAPAARPSPGAPAARPSPGPVPESDATVPEKLAFFERLRTWMRAFPPAPAERAHQERFAALGLLDARSPYARPPAALVRALVAGREAGEARLDELSRRGTTVPLNGWRSAAHRYDYNVDHLELGTLDEPQWKFADRARGRIERAVAARDMLWGSHGYEIVQAEAVEDADGLPLDGTQRYTLTFPAPPAAGAWSLTMYDADHRLVENPLHRYAIGSRTAGLRDAAGGSLTLLLQQALPARRAERANWLPAPQGGLRPVLRLYRPGRAVLDGSDVLPPLVRRR